ncbi:hypothetical protein ACFOOM_25920 [Streptomyces echinoruber]
MRIPGPTAEAEVEQGEGEDPDPPSSSGMHSYDRLVRAAIERQEWADRMNGLDKQRTDDWIRLLQAQARESRLSLRHALMCCTGCVVAVLACVGGLLLVAGMLGITSPLVTGSLVATAMSFVTGLSMRMGRLVSECTSVPVQPPTLSADRRAVVPEQASGDHR